MTGNTRLTKRRVTGNEVTQHNSSVTDPCVTKKMAVLRGYSHSSRPVTYPHTTFSKYRGKRDGKPGNPPMSVYAEMRCRKFRGGVCYQRPRSRMTDLPRLAQALGHPVLSFTYRDGMARAVLGDGRIVVGIGGTKAEAWGNLLTQVQGVRV